MATVLVAFAVTELRPNQISAGKETSVPPPATELMAPARNAAPKATAACVRSKYAILTLRWGRLQPANPSEAGTCRLPANRSPWKRRHTTLEIDRLTSYCTKTDTICHKMADHGTIPGNTAQNYLYRFAHSGHSERPAQADPVALPGLLGTD